MQTGHFVDVDMPNALIAAYVDVLQLTVEPSTTRHVGIIALRNVHHALDIGARRKCLGRVERNDKRDRNALGSEIFTCHHNYIRAERMADQDDRTAVPCVISRRDLIRYRFPRAIFVNT